jgi:DNA polymerase-3 subunit beta
MSLTKTEKSFEFAATDSHRLAVVSLPVEESVPDFKLVISQSAAKEILKIIPVSRAESISISVQSNEYIKFVIGSFTIISRLLQGTYPNYNQLLPRSFSVRMIVNKKEYLKKIELVNIVAEQKNHLMKMSVKDDILCLSAESEGNTGKETMLLKENPELSDVEIGFNTKYLLDGLKTIQGEDIVINANKPNQPVVFKPAGDFCDSSYMVMPIQLVR